jgi:hypothetical protein
MAPRIRNAVRRYGGEICGSGNTGTHLVPAYNGQHYCFDETHPGPPYLTGGPLTIRKKKILIKRFSSFSANVSVLAWYKGYMVALPYVPLVEPQPTDLTGWGAKGWSRTQPLHPIYNLGVSIGELKDLPGMFRQTLAGIRALRSWGNAVAHPGTTVRDFLKRASHIPRNTGDAYLYGAFGLAPMLQDLLFLLKMREKLDKKISWLRRHNGKSVRAKIELDSWSYSESIARSISPSASVRPPLATQLYAAGMTTPVSNPILKTYQRRIWYSAKYRYYIPELADDPRTKAPPGALVADLLGLSPDPAIIYKLTPWSWLLDWFTSVGAALSNVYTRARYGVVAQYAYVMCSETLIYESRGQVTMHTGVRTAGVWSGPDVYFDGASRTEYTFRQREEANPFGFGITFASLSAYQWSILAALGLSRGGKHAAPRA